LVVDAMKRDTRSGGEGEAMVDPIGVGAAASTDAVASPFAAIGQVALVWQADDGENTNIATQAIAYQQAAREEPEVEFLYDAADDEVEELLDDLAEDIAGVWSEI